MPDILAVHAGSRPEHPALLSGERVLTYAGYNRLSNRAAHALAALGVRRGDRVATQAFNSEAGFIVASGVRKLGAVGVPINFRLRGSELAYVLNDSAPTVILAGADFVAHLEAVRPGLEGDPALVALAGGESPAGWRAFPRLLEAASEAEPPDPGLDGLGATMIYTSGTTGRPKGAYRPHGLSLERILQTIAIFELRDTDVHLMAGPGYHSAVSYFAALTIVCGGTVVIMPRFDAEEALRLVERHRVTTTFMAPTLLQRIVDLPDAVRARHQVASMRALILGAAPCPQILKERAVAQFGEALWEFYGSTETGINLVLQPEDQLRKPGSAGRPPEGHEIVLIDEAGGIEAAVGQPGVLHVRNDSLAEYYRKPQATESSMRDGYFSVGDIAYRDSEGYYYICDRQIDMIISGGVNIYPAEVEAVLHGHPGVLDVAVIGVPDDHWGERVKAVVALRPGASVTAEALVEWCRGRVADYKCPRSVDLVADLPRDPAGKLLKRQIREPYWEGSGRRI